MATFREYVYYYKDKSFQDVPFNDVDSMIFTQIVYADFEGIVPSDRGRYILFSDAVRLFLRKYSEDKRKVPRFIREVYDLLDMLRDSKRYENVRMYYYVKTVDQEKQFCAMTLRYADHTYIAFEGTDSSIIGWKEDFLMAKTFPVPSQRHAVQYLNDTVGFWDNYVIIGGHSKGGNLAMTASMLSSPRIRMKIKRVYNFDGPGFRTKESESLAYQRMSKKLKMFVPEDSTVGMILFHPSDYQVVKSTAVGLWQHDPLTWECFGGIFVPGTLTKRSKSLEESNIQFIHSMDVEKRGRFIDAFFSILERLGIHDTSQFFKLNLSQALQIVKDIKNIDSEMRKTMIDLLKILLKGV